MAPRPEKNGPLAAGPNIFKFYNGGDSWHWSLDLGVKYAFLIAVVVGILEIVPLVGPIISGSLAVIIALSQSTTLGLWTLIFFIAAHQLENHILVPLLIKKLVGLNPVAIILAILVGAKLGGVFGIILAVPLAAVVDEFFDDLAKKKTALNTATQD